jgi:hypothetical protein
VVRVFTASEVGATGLEIGKGTLSRWMGGVFISSCVQ